MFVFRKLGSILPVLFIVSVVTLLLTELMPGDPAYAILGDQATPEQVDRVHEQLGLDKPLLERYGSWLTSIVQGDLGESLRTGRPVLGSILQRLPVTVELAALALSLALVMAIPLGVATAYRADTTLDRVWSLGSSVLISTPHFVSGLILVWLVSVQFGLLPAAGWVPITESVSENLRYMLLPALTLALLELPVFSRLLRSDMVATLGREFILAARAKGLRTRYILLRHALRPSSFSLLTLSGLSLGRLLGGTIIVESIFGLPGIGQLMLTAVTEVDVVVIQGVVLFVAIGYVLINTVVDVVYGYLDPRIRTAAG